MIDEKNINFTYIVNELNKINLNFEKLNDTFISKCKLFENKISTLDNKINYIENKLKLSKNYIEEENNNDILKELLKDNTINIEKEIVLRALSYRDYRTIIILFNEIYFYENNMFNKYPIKVVGKRSFEYYLNKKWIHDQYGHYIKHTILLNIQNILFKYNNTDYINNYDNLVMNQDFIYKITEEKFSKKYFRHIIDEIKNS